MEFIHRSVLSEPTVRALIDTGFQAWAKVRTGDIHDLPACDGTFVDGTFGRGGHSRLLLQQLSPDARLIVFDKDPQAIEVAQALQKEDSRVQVVHGGFSTLSSVLPELGITSINGLMLDLGISSPQVDDALRGFSFMRDGPLDMRMNTQKGPTAAQWLATVDFDELKEVISRYGEERFAVKIAKTIISSRESRPLSTTLELAELVAGVVRTREKGQHPATRTFQAIRIHLNQELQELTLALQAALALLAPQGRLAVISFHSLEDRIVKQFIAGASQPQAAYARLPIAEKDMPQPVLKRLGRIFPDSQEIAENPRARSAVLRVAERTSASLSENNLLPISRSARLVEMQNTWVAKEKA